MVVNGMDTLAAEANVFCFPHQLTLKRKGFTLSHSLIKNPMPKGLGKHIEEGSHIKQTDKTSKLIHSSYTGTKGDLPATLNV